MQDENNEIEWRGLFSAKRRRVAVPGTRYIHIVLGKRREIGDGREIVGYKYVLQVFKSASSRSREENSLCMQSRDGEERRRCGSLRKRARFIASALNTIKITVGDRSRGVVNAVQKEEEKKEKALYGKQWQFSKDKGTREKFRENNGTDFISP